MYLRKCGGDLLSSLFCCVSGVPIRKIPGGTWETCASRMPLVSYIPTLLITNDIRGLLHVGVRSSQVNVSELYPIKRIQDRLSGDIERVRMRGIISTSNRQSLIFALQNWAEPQP